VVSTSSSDAATKPEGYAVNIRSDQSRNKNLRKRTRNSLRNDGGFHFII